MIQGRIACYEILELAGSGGMGEVYRARDCHLGRPVALKVLRPERSTDPRLRRLLLREARAYSALSHPGVVSVYAVGRDRGVDYIAMEWVSGRSLASELEGGPMPAARALEIALRLAEALAAVHDAAIVHRDVKPHNVMIGGAGQVKLLDFGVAKVDAAIDVTTLSGTGPRWERSGEGAPGTLAYMAPEQALGEPVDARADVFSLGVVLYEMLAGRRPFDGRTMPALVRRILYSEPAPLSGARGEVPEPVKKVLRRALAKRPADRYPGMRELAADLRPLVGSPAGVRAAAPAPDRRTLRGRSTRTESSANRRGPPSRRLRLVSGLPLIALALVSLLWHPGTRPGPELHGGAGREPAAPSLPATPYESFQSGMRLLARYDREGYVERSIAHFHAALHGAPDYAPAHAGLAVAHWRMFRDRRDPTWLDQAAGHARRALELAPLLTEARIAQAQILTSAGRRDEAESELEELRRLEPGNSEVIAGQAEIARSRGDLAAAAELLAAAIALAPESWELHSELGRVQSARGETDAAEAAFRRAIALAPDNALVHRNLGAVLHYQGRYDEAVAALQKSITIRPTARAYSNLGTAYFFQGFYREAAAALEAAREHGANHYLLWANLGDAYRQLPGMEQDAVLCFERAIQLLRAETADGEPDAATRSRVALYLVKSGRPARALGELAGLEPLAAAPADVAYRAAVAYELAGEREPGLRAIEIALRNGYPAVEILTEPELTALRQTVAFHQILVRFDTPVDG